MQTKDYAFEVKEVTDAGQIEGYASTFGGAADSYGDVVAPGAFLKSLAKHRREGTMPAMLWGHESYNLPIGNWVDMAEDGKGLWVKGELDLEDTEGMRVYRALKRRSVRGLSIGYRTAKQRADGDVNVLEEVELFEVSVVNFPANRRSNVEVVKSAPDDLVQKLAAGDRLTEREWERLFKSVGLSNTQAERAVRINLKGQGEPDDTAMAMDLMKALRA